MNFRKLVEDGYGELAEKLPETDKEFLRGFRYAIEMLRDFKDNIEYYIEQDAPTLYNIEMELAQLTVDNAIDWLEADADEILVSLVDHSIFENGKVAQK